MVVVDVKKGPVDALNVCALISFFLCFFDFTFMCSKHVFVVQVEMMMMMMMMMMMRSEEPRLSEESSDLLIVAFTGFKFE